MLLRFSVANHLSIATAQELSFAASSLRDPRDGLIASRAVPAGAVLPALVIYGANASGKTNLVHALGTMKHWVLSSHTRGKPGGGVPRNAFRLDPAKSQEPSRFDVDFIVARRTVSLRFRGDRRRLRFGVALCSFPNRIAQRDVRCETERNSNSGAG